MMQLSDTAAVRKHLATLLHSYRTDGIETWLVTDEWQQRAGFTGQYYPVHAWRPVVHEALNLLVVAGLIERKIVTGMTFAYRAPLMTRAAVSRQMCQGGLW